MKFLHSSAYNSTFLLAVLIAVTTAVIAVAYFENSPHVKAALPAPGGVEGAEYWIRPEGMDLTGTNITNWDDVDGLHANESFTNSLPFIENAYNFNPAANFPGDRYMRFVSQQLLSGATAGEVFYMLESTGAHNQNDGYPSEFGGGGSTATWEYDYADSQIYSGWGSTVRKNWNPLTAPGGGPARDVLDPHIYNVLSAPGQWTARFDGLTNFTTATNTPSFNSSPSSHTYIGASHHSIFRGRMSEVIVFGRDLTAAERARVQSYLAIKYGITLGTTASPTDYVASDGTTIFWAGDSTYQNDVASIGRDDNSALSQKQSRSVNATSVATIGNGDNFATTNSANPNNFSVNKTFMAWGHDNGIVNTWGTAGAPANYSRVSRTWKIDETGTVGNTTVSIDVANTNADIPNAESGYYLLRDTDTDSSFTDETPVRLYDDGTHGDMTAGDNQFTTNMVDFTDGETFTVATFSGQYKVIITPVDNLTGEDGDTGSFKVSLLAQPTAAVTIALSSSNTGEGTVPASITILPANWNNPDANVVTVTGVDDDPDVPDGAVPYTIITGDVTSADPNFDALAGADVDDVSMTNQNDDPPGINATIIDNTSGEDGSTATVRFELLSMPSGDVTIPLSISDSSEASLGATTSITITPANWDQPQNNEVTITGLDDAFTDGDILYQLITGDPTSGDADYDALTQTDVADIYLTNADNDDDGDGVPQEVEDAAPNGGDANNDGTPDGLQPHVASFVNGTTGEYVVLEIDDTCQLNTTASSKEAAQTTVDPEYEYPHGFIDFEANCGTPGFVTTVQQYYFGATEDGFVMRKHNPSSGEYFTVDGASLGQQIISGVAYTKATFQITDGGKLDTDGAANGVIVDPAGLGLQISASGSGPDNLAGTGQSVVLYTLAASLLIAASLGMISGHSIINLIKGVDRRRN